MSRMDQYAITASIDGVDLGVFDKLAGGDVETEENKYRPGAMGPQVALGGSKDVTNFTLTRLYKLDRDHPLVGFLQQKAGVGTVVANKQPLDVNGAVFGKPMVYTGVLRNVNWPDADSESSGPALLALEVSASGTIG